jgi:glyoxylase-like metal-dependent hydrolase (beta-lactamase superfamily II)
MSNTTDGPAMRLVDDWDHERPWDAAGVYAVAPGVLRIPLPLPDDGLKAVNVYILDDADGPLLIDSGQALSNSQHQLGAGLAELGHRLSDVQRFLVTHVHRDHYTQAVTMRRELGTHISLGSGEHPSVTTVREPGIDRVAAQLELLVTCGARELADRNRGFDDGLPADLWEDPDQWLVHGDVVSHGLRRLDVLETPGHTRGHVVFRDRAAALLFAGDHILPRITPSIGFEPAVTPLPLRDYLDSLRLILSYDDTWLLPAHGPVTQSVHHRANQLLEHHAERLTASLGHVDADHRTALEVAHQLRWTRHARALDDMSPVDQMLAVLETKAHLDVLVHRGRLDVHVEVDTGVAYYASTSSTSEL